MFNCKACESTLSIKSFNAIEMVAGTRDKFTYDVCTSCGSSQLRASNINVARYYDNSEYSSFRRWTVSPVKRMLIDMRNSYSYGAKFTFLGFLLNKIWPLDVAHSSIKKYLIKKDMKFLDVGCGGGRLLDDLSRIGFNNIEGSDPYIESDVLKKCYKITKKHLSKIEGRYDIIRMHHSFEHMDEPAAALADVRRLLTYNGICILTIPVSDFILEKYKECSYIIQAPQHYMIYSISGLNLLAKRVGFTVMTVTRDSFGIAAWMKMSLLWARNISSNEINRSLNSYFSRSELRLFDAKERELAKLSLGDNVTFILKNDTHNCF